ncbi:MAG: TIGR00266 family protein [Deltaproteobacteria bacterium]|nr:TIGR00266 family protein [Deltaproteobacteria bacterium]
MPKYEIIYGEAFPLIRYNLEKGEKLKAESNAMVAMSATIDVTGGADGGIFKSFTRLLAGEKFFFQYLEATRGPGEVLLAHSHPGGVMDVDLDGSYGLIVQKDGFLAATSGIEVGTTLQSLGRGLFSQEGFFVVKITGRGVVFVSSYGAIHPLELKPGEQVIVDNGHLVAWPDYMTYTLEKASNGWFNSWKSGENLVCRFTGPGTVLIQSRNPNALVGWLKVLGLGANK